ncbi:MAG: penicillin-binding protein 2 [Alcanivoracaceae bacterium]|nr:penicillin-binding protein 2 [Alcanivoracaceae bacterium]
MYRSHKQIKNPQNEAKIFAGRIFSSVVIIAIAISIIFSRFFYLQIIQHKVLLSNSEKNRIKTTSLPPARGFIYDRNGKLLVDNLPTYRLQVIPEKVDSLKKQLSAIQLFIKINDDDITDILNKEKNNRPFKPIIIKAKLTEKELSAFIARKHAFIGFDAQPYLIRHYKYTDILAHVVGYVGRINDEDTKRLDKKRYSGTEYTGKRGLEKFHEKTLHGQPGSLIVETNAKGRVLNAIEQNLPVSGQDITLTIDIDLQKVAYDALGDLTGSVIAINPKNGEILAMISKPGFDPNDFVNGISQLKYSRLINSDEKPLFNRSIKGGYEPGSTIKPYMALAGLYNNVIDLNFSMFSKGYFQLKKQDRKYHDWKKGGHGRVNIKQSLTQSVNTFYYSLALNLGIDRIHDFLSQFRFGELSNIELLGEMRGLLPSREWKKANKGTIWFPGETVITGIGQGFLVSTPIQLATSLSILANKGKYIKPHLIKKEAVIAQNLALDILPEYWDIVHDGMIGVVHDIKGTARSIKSADYLIAGKSGTSQVYGKKEEDVYNKNIQTPKHLRNHALFIAFAPADDPEIAVVVVAEHGASGSRTAAPIAGKVIEKYMHDIYQAPGVALTKVKK